MWLRYFFPRRRYEYYEKMCPSVWSLDRKCRFSLFLFFFFLFLLMMLMVNVCHRLGRFSKMSLNRSRQFSLNLIKKAFFISNVSRTFEAYLVMPNIFGNGREPWSSGFGRRLMFPRSWVQIPALYTGRIFFHICLL